MTSDDLSAVLWAAHKLGVDLSACGARVALLTAIERRTVGNVIPADFDATIPGNGATFREVYDLAFGAA